MERRLGGQLGAHEDGRKLRVGSGQVHSGAESGDWTEGICGVKVGDEDSGVPVGIMVRCERVVIPEDMS